MQVSIPEWIEIALLGYACVVLLACGVVLVPMTPLGRCLARLMTCLAALFGYAILIRLFGPNDPMFVAGVVLRLALATASTSLLVELVRVTQGPVHIALLANDVLRDGVVRMADHIGLRKGRDR